MAQRYEYQDIDGHVILLFVHPAILSDKKQIAFQGDVKKVTLWRCKA